MQDYISDKFSSPSILTIIYYVSFLCLGMTAAVIGPSLPNLADQTQVQLKQISLLFPAISLGYLFGALTSGRIYDHRPGHPVMAAALVIMGLMVALIPTLSSLWVMLLVMLILGTAQAYLDIGGNTLLVWLYQDRVNPFINGLHLFWGIGSFLSPILVAQGVLRTGSISWAFWFIALSLLPAAFIIKAASSPRAPSRGLSPVPHQAPSWSLVLLFVLFYMTFVGSEGAYGGWIYTYAVELRIANPTSSAYLTSAYWIALTITRLISIPLALRLQPRTMLIINLVGSLIALILGVVGKGLPAFAWTSTILFGASVATLFPVALSYANQFISVTGQFTSWLFVGSSLGGMLIPWLVGQYFEQYGPQSVMIILLVDMIACLGIFGVLDYKRRKTYILE